MSTYSLSHLSDPALLQGLAALVARDRAVTAELLAHIAEIDARKLYLPAAYPSMFAYCVGELGLSEHAAYKRIQAARRAREFPAIFPALADGRLHLTGLGLLAPHLTPENADELLLAGRWEADMEQATAEAVERFSVLPGVPLLQFPRLGALGGFEGGADKVTRQFALALAREEVAHRDPPLEGAP